MDHYRSRADRRISITSPVHGHENPTCGDSIKLEVVVGDDGHLAAVRFDGKGCAISTASASLMTESVKGLSVTDARQRAESFIKALRGELPATALDDMGDLAAFKGLTSFPSGSSARRLPGTLFWFPCRARSTVLRAQGLRQEE